MDVPRTVPRMVWGRKNFQKAWTKPRTGFDDTLKAASTPDWWAFGCSGSAAKSAVEKVRT